MEGFKAGSRQCRNGLVSLRRVSGRANDTIYFRAQQRSERVPDGSGHCLTPLLEPYRKRGVEPRSSSRGDGHRPVLLPCRKRRKAGVATAFPHLILRANGSV